MYSNETGNGGFNFYSLDTDTAVATPLGSVARGAGEASPSYYAGYHREVSADGKLFYRLGYKLVTQQQEQGISITTVAGSAGTEGSTAWKDELWTVGLSVSCAKPCCWKEERSGSGGVVD